MAVIIAKRAGRGRVGRSSPGVSFLAGGTYFLRDGDKLKVLGELTWDVTNAFDQACRNLVSEAEDQPTIDLTDIERLGSTHLGILVATAAEATASGKELILLVGSALGRIVEVAELDRMATVQCVDDPWEELR